MEIPSKIFVVGRRAVYLLLAFSQSLSAQPQRLLQLEPLSVQRKRALVVGNATYPLGRLQNSINDAKAVLVVLRRLGFQAILKQDLTRREMDEAIDSFSESLEPSDLALFYYAGHGLQVAQENFLVPIDFAARSEADVRYEAYSASRLRDKMEEKRPRLRIIILDACRNNPFRASSRSSSRGLAPMDAAEGTYIAFATRDNSTADDNPKEANGLFTKYLVATLDTPGLHLKEIFEKVKEDVYVASNHRQQPYTYDGIVGRYYFTAPSAPTSAPDLSLQTELAYWNSIDKSDRALLESYLKRYPNGQFVEIASRNISHSTTTAERIDRPALVPEVTPARPSPGETRVKPKDAAALSPVSRDSEPAPGFVRDDPRDGQKYVWVPRGSFQMGCSAGDSSCLENEKPAHLVEITRGFWIGQTEVTQEAFQRTMGRTTSQFQGDRLPAESVTWTEASEYCRKAGGRLPTEAEWEYAARAGSVSELYGQPGFIAWYGGNSGGKTHQVGQKAPNQWGLYDMLGNVWEWTADWYAENYYGGSSLRDPLGPSSGQQRVLRGGDWNVTYSRLVRVSVRNKDNPEVRYVNIGFRCVLEVL